MFYSQMYYLYYFQREFTLLKYATSKILFQYKNNRIYRLNSTLEFWNSDEYLKK